MWSVHQTFVCMATAYQQISIGSRPIFPKRRSRFGRHAKYMPGICNRRLGVAAFMLFYLCWFCGLALLFWHWRWFCRRRHCWSVIIVRLSPRADDVPCRRQMFLRQDRIILRLTWMTLCQRRFKLLHKPNVQGSSIDSRFLEVAPQKCFRM